MAGPSRHRRACTLLLLVAAAVLGVLASPPRAHAAFAGRNGLIGYEARSSVRGVLYARTPDGSALRRFFAGGQASDPAFSPQGRRLAFARRGAVWTTYLDGAGLRKLTAGPQADADPAWSPRGDALAFTRGAAGRRQVFTIGADGAALRRLTFAGADDRAPAWSSRDRIVFVRRTRRSGTDLYVTDPAGTPARRLTRSRADDDAPSWSPDGRRIAFVRGRRLRRDVWVMNADGTGARRVTRLRRRVSSPAWSPDGRRIAFAMGRAGRRNVYVVTPRGRGLRPLTRGRTDAHAPDWQADGADPVIAAAGDIACDPADRSFRGAEGGTPRRCHQGQTSDLLFRADLAAILMLGDGQYESGTLDAYLRSFHPTWGRLKGLIHPVPGNHDYRDPGAAGYFDYFNGVGQPTGPAGSRDAGWYSFDVGAWHVIALNSQCAEPRRSPSAAACAAGSVQEQWLRADLAAHPAACTLAYWHHPLFSSSAEGTSPAMAPIWQVLYEAGVDVVLNGHAHTYERFAPQTPLGVPDPARGIRQFVIGSGGKSHQPFAALLPNSEVRDPGTFGVFELTLRPGGYAWAFVAEAGRQFADTGVGTCH